MVLANEHDPSLVIHASLPSLWYPDEQLTKQPSLVVLVVPDSVVHLMAHSNLLNTKHDQTTCQSRLQYTNPSLGYLDSLHHMNKTCQSCPSVKQQGC